jgi:putative tryptophan/tyrosine transport system substrate-binding protein
MMDRRSFVGSLGAFATIPRTAQAQPTRKMYRIGILSLQATSAAPRRPSTEALLRGLSDLGYVYGRDFVTEIRASEGQPERFPTLAAELIRLQVDVILAPGPALAALKQATSSIPVIMSATLDPVGQGFVQSLGHPGGNFTGFSLQTVGKRLELLKDLVPGSAPLAVLWDQPSIIDWHAAQAAARERGWKVISLELRNAGDIEKIFRTALEVRASALLVSAAGILFPRARLVAELSTKNRLPSMYGLREYVEAGGLISYGADINDIWRRAAVFVDKIFKGAKPGDLPVEQPTKFELVINLKTAKALKLTIPQTLLLRADQVIE